MFQLIFLSGCFISDNNDILLPPECVNEEYAIYNLLKKSVYIKSKIFLETPKNTNKNSAITFLNDKNTAVLFYNTKEKNNLHMAVFSKQEKTWRYVLDIPLTGTILDTVLTTKNPKENTEFLIVGTDKNSEKIYNIYNCDIKNFRKIYSSNYSFLTLYDVNSDGVEELISLSEIPQDFTKNKYNLKINEDIQPRIIEYENKNDYKNFSSYKNQGLFLVNSILKDGVRIINCKPGIDSILTKSSEISNYTFNDKTLNGLCLFILTKNVDYKNVIVTSILNFSNNDFFIYQIDTMNRTHPYNSFLFGDINKDSRLEFSFKFPLPGYSDEEGFLKKINKQMEIPYISRWRIINEMEKNHEENNFFKPLKYLKTRDVDDDYKNTFINYNHNYGIKFPDRWLNKVTAKYKNNTENIDFFIYQNSLQKDSQKLLSIKVTYSTDKNNFQNDFFKLYEKNGITYSANIYPNLKLSDPSLKISKKELENIFFTLD